MNTQIKQTIFWLLFIVITSILLLLFMQRNSIKPPIDIESTTPITTNVCDGNKPIPKSNESWLGLSIATIIFGILDLSFIIYAKKKLNSICTNQNLSTRVKLKFIENEEVLFDLPLYLGLGGTVIGFLMIANGFSCSRDVAYVSTVLGIISSALMRVCLLRPCRTTLLIKEEKEVYE